jgi:hypothetical protein
MLASSCVLSIPAEILLGVKLEKKLSLKKKKNKKERLVSSSIFVFGVFQTGFRGTSFCTCSKLY